MSLHALLQAFIAEAAAQGCPCEPAFLATLETLERQVAAGHISEAVAIEAFELSCAMADDDAVPATVGIEVMTTLALRQRGEVKLS